MTDRSDAVTAIGKFQEWLINHYKACPIFVKGVLEDAFKLAFHSKVRPLLIYIHHDNGPATETFCSNIFCSKYLIEYLDENYIVWSWDITDPFNRMMLIEMWKKYFPKEPLLFSIDECPMLIGVFRLPPNDDKNLVYDYEQIVIGDCIPRIATSIDLENVFNQLIDLKEKFVEYDEQIIFDFKKAFELPPEIILEITKYLSFNETISAFSPTILSVLSDNKVTLPIVNPSTQFMKILRQKIDNKEQIRILNIDADQFKHTMKLDSSGKFSQLESLHIRNVKKIDRFYNIRQYFPSLISLSLDCDGSIDFHTLSKIFNLIPNSIKQVKIHGSSIPCSHRSNRFFSVQVEHFNTSVESFILHIDHTRTSLVNDCIQNYDKCVLRTICDYIRIMTKIRYIWIIVDTGNIETLFDVNEWKGLVERCTVLEKITLKVKTNMSNDPQLTQKIEEIKNELHNQRESVQLLVKVK